MAKIYLFISFIFAFPVFGQLSDFTLQVTSTAESCTANGTLAFIVSDTTPGATIVFRVYRLPDVVNPIATQSGLLLNGLTAGNYRVVALQSLGSNSGSQSVDKTIASTIIPLLYNIQTVATLCGNDGKITCQVMNSTAVSYEIFNGPVTRPLQSSNQFTNLPAGNYSVRAFDACGEGVAHTAIVGTEPPTLAIENPSSRILSCNTMSISGYMYGHIAFPLQITLTVYPPSGSPLTFLQTGSSGYYCEVPLLSGGNYTISVLVTDACGNQYSRNNVTVPIPSRGIQLNAQSIPSGCGVSVLLNLQTYNLITPLTLNFTSAPAGFNPALYLNTYPVADSSIEYFSSTSNPPPPGHYVINVTDACGITLSGDADLVYSPSNTSIFSSLRPDCTLGFGGIVIEGSVALTSGQLISAPSGYPVALPQDLSPFLYSGNFTMGHLPAGDYVFVISDSCGVTHNYSIAVEGYTSAAATADISENCDSFTFKLHHQTNAYFSRYLLQKWFPALNQWGHPLTGVIGNPANVDITNGWQVFNEMNVNCPFSGQFRVVKAFSAYGTGNSLLQCQSTIYTFEFTVGPRIINAYTFECTPTASDVIVVGAGIAPLTYRITQKNNLPFLINNGQSSIFLGLQPAVYNFQLEDACGNILNREFDITIPVHLEVTPSNFCGGNTGTLSLPLFTFLSYTWWKGNNIANVLSTNNQLTFTPFNPTVDDGIYHVRVQYPGPNSCIDFTIDYNLLGSDIGIPHAGSGTVTSYCDPPAAIDLYSMLTGTFATGGSWQDNDGSGTLSGHTWTTTGLAPGTYHLRYDVNTECGNDHTIVTIILKPNPELPVVPAMIAVCEGEIVRLDAGHINGTDYHWEGPNGFTSDAAQPEIANISTIMSGAYQVTASLGGCTSDPALVNIAVLPLPDFTVTDDCAGNRFTLLVTPGNNTFNPETASYSWNGPDGFSSASNPVDISYHAAGIYTIGVTTADGCFAQKEINVLNTFCGIPAAISPNQDGKNDFLNLAGLDVLKLEIFSRYGRLVYKEDNYTNQWHGQDFNNRELPDATYYYYISFGNGDQRTGWVYVMR